MIGRVTIRNFKRFREQTFELADSVVLAGPNNAGKSTLLQAIATWRFGLDRWFAQRSGGRAVTRSGVAIPRADITAVPLREMNLLWEDRRVTGPRGMSGSRRLIEIVLEGHAVGESWTCGLELQYANPELVYARPLDAKSLDPSALRDFPPPPARQLNIVHVPPLSGIERDEPRRDRGMQDLLVGQGRPGEILRNLLLEVAESDDEEGWLALQEHIRDLFRIELSKPSYSPSQPYIVCEFMEPGHSRPLDLSNAGSGTLQVLLLLGFLYARPAGVILLDEPDAHQHVILQKQVYDLVHRVARERGGQVIVATHSEVILNATEPARVIGFFGDELDGTAVSPNPRGEHSMEKTSYIDHVRIQGFRSLESIELSEIPKAVVLIGANGSGKSNFFRFFEMLNWMLPSRRLAEFVERQGGADDQLFGGSERCPRVGRHGDHANGSGAATTIASCSPTRIPAVSYSRERHSASPARVSTRRTGSISEAATWRPRSSKRRNPGDLIVSRPG